MCCWISVKAVSLGVVVGLGRKLDKASASAGDGDAFGAVLLLGGVSFKPSSFSLSRHEDNFALPVMCTLSLGLGDLSVWDGCGAVPLQQWTMPSSSSSSFPASLLV
jgi:hypothetical protein